MKTAKKIYLAAFLVFAAVLLFTGCQKKTEPTPPPDASQTVTIPAAQAIEAAGEQTTCPIMKGNPINKDIFVEYKGKKVYFCCPACIEAFNKDPEKYVKELPQFKG